MSFEDWWEQEVSARGVKETNIMRGVAYAAYRAGKLDTATHLAHLIKDVSSMIHIPLFKEVIEKLKRCRECWEDGQDVDISLEWLDLLVQLGLLVRTHKSPPRWEITMPGYAALHSAKRMN